jgi:hypothetical protein
LGLFKLFNKSISCVANTRKKKSNSGPESKLFEVNNAYHDDSIEEFDPTYLEKVTPLQGGLNGRVMTLTFKHNNVRTNAVLKSVLELTSDNIFYEFAIGLYINRYNAFLPCFLETYTLYEYEDNKTFIKTVNDNDPKQFFTAAKISQCNVVKNKKQLKKCLHNSCTKSYFAILMEAVISEGSMSLITYLDQIKKNVKEKKLSILYQIYSVLHYLKNEFSHNDLHLNNVLLHKIPDNKYIDLVYHTSPTSTTIIKTQYIARIIDYGRCFMTGISGTYLHKEIMIKMMKKEGYDRCSSLNLIFHHVMLRPDTTIFNEIYNERIATVDFAYESIQKKANSLFSSPMAEYPHVHGLQCIGQLHIYFTEHMDIPMTFIAQNSGEKRFGTIFKTRTIRRKKTCYTASPPVDSDSDSDSDSDLDDTVDLNYTNV